MLTESRLEATITPFEWSPPWHGSGKVSNIPSRHSIYYDILSEILSGIYFDILSDIFLAFDLASILTLFLAFYLATRVQAWLTASRAGVLGFGPGALNSIWSWRYSVRAQASIEGRKEWYICENLEALTWQVKNGHLKMGWDCNEDGFARINMLGPRDSGTYFLFW